MADEVLSASFKSLSLDALQQPQVSTPKNQQATRGQPRRHQRNAVEPKSDASRTSNDPGRRKTSPDVNGNETSGDPLDNAPGSPTRDKEQPDNLYVVQVIYPNEKIIGVYTQVTEANKYAMAYMSAANGILASEIGDAGGFFGSNIPAGKRAGKRSSWTGALEIILSGGRPWIRVLPNKCPEPPGSSDRGLAYLALDQVGSGLFVIGAFRSKDDAWEGCKKYWGQLSYCTPVVDMSQWVTKEGMYHAKGLIVGRAHHWFVKQYVIL